jgi:hypothetical protein
MWANIYIIHFSLTFPFYSEEGVSATKGGESVADVKIEDGIIRIKELDIQDGKSAKVLEEYPESRWPEITRRALKIGLGYLKGGADS